MGELTFFLGLQVQQKKDGVFICQDKYVDEILKKFVKTASTPIETQKPLLKDEDGEEVDVYMYRSMIGLLMYLTSSRPDIMFAVCAYARYQVNPKVSHLHDVKRIFRYLKGQPKLGLWYPKDSPFDLVAYTDSDYAGASLDRKSTTGGCQFLRCRLISWQCKKQTVVANSTTEAEYVAIVVDKCFGFRINYLIMVILNTAGIINIVKIVRKRIKRVGENKNRKRDVWNKNRQRVLVSKRIERSGELKNRKRVEYIKNRQSVWNGIGVNAGDSKLMLLGLCYYCWVKTVRLFRATVKVKTINGEVQLQALMDGKKIIITESIVRRDLQLEDAEGVDCLPNATIFEELTRMGAKTTAWNEFSSIMASVIICLAINQKFNFSNYIFESMVKNLDNTDEAVNKEMGNSLERTVTTATSLDAEQDRGNIAKTQSKATPNESSSLGTTLGGDPRRQETMGDTITQNRLKLKELMAMCTNLQQRVLDLEKTKTTQAEEIVILKKRVKRLKKKDRRRTHKLKRLYKVSSSRRVESSDDEGLDKYDASKQGRIADIDVDARINLVSTHFDADIDMFGVHDLAGDEVVVESEVVVKTVVEENIRISFRKPSEATTTTTTTTITAAPKPPQDKGKGIMVEEPMVEQAKVEAEYQLAQRLQAEEQEGLSVEDKPKLFQQLLKKIIKYFVAKWAEEKRNKPPTQAQQRKIMSTYLKNIEGWKPKDLKYKSFDFIHKLFDKAMKRVNTFVDMDTELVKDNELSAEGSETRAEGSSKRAGDELE
ncbi:hypothetical protein Tco_0453940 [Tanacetum coccineum]